MNNTALNVYWIILAIGFVAIMWVFIKKTDFLRESGKKDAPYSLARSQLLMWTYIVTVIAVTRWIVSDFDTFQLNETCLILLGIISATRVVSMGIPVTKRMSANSTNYAFKDENPSMGWIHDIIRDENGLPSMARLQNVIFTFVYIVIYVGAFLKEKGEALPVFDSTAYILMGISDSTYVLNKGFSGKNETTRQPSAENANEKVETKT